MMDWYLSDAQRDTSREDLAQQANAQIVMAQLRADFCEARDQDEQRQQWQQVGECFQAVAAELHLCD